MSTGKNEINHTPNESGDVLAPVFEPTPREITFLGAAYALSYKHGVKESIIDDYEIVSDTISSNSISEDQFELEDDIFIVCIKRAKRPKIVDLSKETGPVFDLTTNEILE